MRKPGLRPVRNQTGQKLRTGNKQRLKKRPTGRVDHIGANHKTCHCRAQEPGGTKERSKTMGL
jgi:hypothetical protein